MVRRRLGTRGAEWMYQELVKRINLGHELQHPVAPQHTQKIKNKINKLKSGFDTPPGKGGREGEEEKGW